MRMKRSPAVLRSFRKPVLALVAAAGLVVGSGAHAVAPLATASPVVPGQPTISSAEYANPAALTPPGVALQGGLSRAAERPPLRLHGPDGGGLQTLPAPGTHARPDRPGSVRTADRAISTRSALSRAGRDSAPSTAPPSFPS